MRKVRGGRKRSIEREDTEVEAAREERKTKKNNNFWEELIAYLSLWQIAADPRQQSNL
jgi:hypothetical protein